MDHHISSQFAQEDQRAKDALERKRKDLAAAKRLSPSLVASLEAEVTACTAALSKAREAGAAYDVERTEVAIAEAANRAALGELNTSHDVDDASVERIVNEAHRTEYVLAARRRREAAAKSIAQSQYARVQKDIAERNAASAFASRVVSAIIVRDETQVSEEAKAISKRPSTVAWLPVVIDEARHVYAERAEEQFTKPHAPTPPPVDVFNDYFARFFGELQSRRQSLLAQAKELGEILA